MKSKTAFIMPKGGKHGKERGETARGGRKNGTNPHKGLFCLHRAKHGQVLCGSLYRWRQLPQRMGGAGISAVHGRTGDFCKDRRKERRNAPHLSSARRADGTAQDHSERGAQEQTQNERGRRFRNRGSGGEFAGRDRTARQYPQEPRMPAALFGVYRTQSAEPYASERIAIGGNDGPCPLEDLGGQIDASAEGSLFVRSACGRKSVWRTVRAGDSRKLGGELLSVQFFGQDGPARAVYRQG